MGDGHGDRPARASRRHRADLYLRHRAASTGHPGRHRTGPDQAGANINGAHLKGAHLNDADLNDANVTDANLDTATLFSANLTDTHLNGADLTEANLLNANLKGADLTSTGLGYANFNGADLGHANLSDADLNNADLAEAKLVTVGQVVSARPDFIYQASQAAGLGPPGSGADSRCGETTVDTLTSSCKHVEHVMRTFNIVGLHLRKKVRTTIPEPSATPSRTCWRDFTATTPNTKYMGDITYLPIGGGQFLYLATVLDLRSKRLAGWSIADHMRTELVTDALRAAARARGADGLRGAIFHSDNGAQYVVEGVRPGLLGTRRDQIARRGGHERGRTPPRRA